MSKFFKWLISRRDTKEKISILEKKKKGINELEHRPKEIFQNKMLNFTMLTSSSGER